MPSLSADPQTLAKIAEKVDSLRTTQSGAVRALSEVATFIGCDRSLPYAWASRRKGSRPTRPMLAGLALFQLTDGRRSALPDLPLPETIARTAEWFSTAGFDPAEAEAAVKQALRQLNGEQPDKTPSLEGPAFSNDLLSVFSAAHAMVSLEGLGQMERWRLLLNRISQEDALQNVRHWSTCCGNEAAAASYLAADEGDLEELFHDGIWTIRDLIANKRCRCSMFLDIHSEISPPDWEEYERILQAHLREMPEARKSLRVWLRHQPKSLKSNEPLAVWSFFDERRSLQFGRLLISVGKERDFVDTISVLKKRRGQQPIFWRFLSAPLTFQQSLDHLRQYGQVVFDEDSAGSRESEGPFIPLDDASWKEWKIENSTEN